MCSIELEDGSVCGAAGLWGGHYGAQVGPLVADLVRAEGEVRKCVLPGSYVGTRYDRRFDFAGAVLGHYPPARGAAPPEVVPQDGEGCPRGYSSDGVL